MNFERHTDPYKSLDSGLHKTIPLLKERYDKLVKHLFKFRNQDWVRKYQDELWESRPSRFIICVGWANICNIFNELTKEEYSIIFSIVEKQCKELKL